MRVGVLEDDADHAVLITQALNADGHSTEVYATGARFLQAMVRETFDVLVLDWMLPDMTGIEVLDWLRQLEDRTPVLFVTSRDTENDIVEALRHGADDFLVKPPRRSELLARLKALKRRADGFAGNGPLTVGAYELDAGSTSARLHGELLELTERQFQLALVLFRNPGRLLSRQYLLEAVWGLNAQVQTRTLDIHVSQLRTLLRLADNGWRINSVYAHGYRLEPLA
ncbi:MAG: response regulator transcription factor [Rhodoferax sp.]|nr:response regulator transcription factor [Rhodoferax sp.]